MASVFISYSRRDNEFARRLTEAFEQAKLDYWIDWNDIPPTVDWWKEIERGIEEADVYIFIISPDAVKSQVNLKELDHAVKNGKRIIPILIREIPHDDSPRALMPLNWLYIRESDDFDQGINTVISAIRTDHEWTKFHSQLQVKALEWERKGKDKSYLLRGKALQEAEEQLILNSTKEPQPTELQRYYVYTSRQYHPQNQSFLSRGVEAVSSAFGGRGGQTQEARPPAAKVEPGKAPQSAPIPSAPLPSKIDRYEIRSEIGRGGMATVYLAYDPRFDRDVAIKVLPRELLKADPQFRLRFENEAKMIAKVEHAAIVPVYDVGEQQGVPYVVMRYMDGGSLSYRISLGKLTMQDAARLLDQIAPALDEVHAKNIVHCDLKPGNILFDRRDNPFISDFGIAMFAGSAIGDTIVGTPAYMAPEQAQGNPFDGRVDIYALGIILFEILTGQQPYIADTPMAVVVKQITDPVPHVRSLRPDLPIAVDQVVQKAMAKDASQRFQTAGHLTASFKAAIAGEPFPEGVEIGPETTAPGTEESIPETPAETEDERYQRLRAAIAANILARNRAQAVYNDQARGEDQLGIKEEVDALAETLLLRDVEPPVAVGIMGGWGSGKSFVMYLISRYVEETRAREIKKGWAEDGKGGNLDIPAYVGHIYQVHFNAWTYAKSNLWASLMDTIFTCLNRQMQLERLFAYQDIEEKDLPKIGVDTDANERERVRFAGQVCDGMLKGGSLFKKIYQEDYQIALDPELSPETRDRLTFWSERLLSQNLLWQVMRNQNEAALKIMRKDEQELGQYKARREALEQARHTETISGAKLSDQVAKKAYHSLLQTTLLGFVTDAFGKSIREDLKHSEVDLEALKEKTQKLLEGPQGFLDAFRRNRYYWLAALSVAAVAVLFPYLWNRFAQTQVSHAIGYVVALASAAAPFVPTLQDRWRKIVEFEAETRKAFENAYLGQQTRRAEEIAAADMPLNEKVKRLEEEVNNGSLPACDVLIRIKENQIEQQRRKIGPAAKYSNLLEFVQSRLDAATYENQLGLMHQVRQDIDELTYSLISSANKDIFPRGKPRVILYIDDLDRCPPQRVVEILEAVQLLLNTKLFVVILGLDTRYVTRALEKEYKEILQHEGDPSGLDYIEKIIQIPYRVRPIERDSLQKYLATQMDVEKPPEPEPVVQAAPEAPEPAASLTFEPVPISVDPHMQAETVAASEQAAVPDAQVAPAVAEQAVPPAETEAQAGSSGIEEQAPTPEVLTAQADIVGESVQPPEGNKLELPQEVAAGNSPEVETRPPEEDLPPAVVQFKQEDLIDLTTCCQQISLTPRSIKRVVNVFKLMKIFWFRSDKDAGLAERDRPRPVKQAAICLLALASAYPEVMREVFVHLENLYRHGQEHSRLFTALNNIKLPPGSAHELAWQFQRYKQDVGMLRSMPGDGWNDLEHLTLQQLKFSTFNIVRSFSFVGDPVYWTDDEEDKGRANGHVPGRRVAKVNRN